MPYVIMKSLKLVALIIVNSISDMPLMKLVVKNRNYARSVIMFIVKNAIIATTQKNMK